MGNRPPPHIQERIEMNSLSLQGVNGELGICLNCNKNEIFRFIGHFGFCHECYTNINNEMARTLPVVEATQ